MDLSDRCTFLQLIRNRHYVSSLSGFGMQHVSQQDNTRLYVRSSAFRKLQKGNPCILNHEVGWKGQKVYQISILHDNICSPRFQVDTLATSQLPVRARPRCSPLLGTLTFPLERNSALRIGKEPQWHSLLRILTLKTWFDCRKTPK